MENDAIRDELLKMDRMGRVRVSAERREALLDEFERCGVSAMQFAAHVGVKYQTFASWRYQRDRKRRVAETQPKALVLPIPAAAAGRVQWLEALVEKPQAEVGAVEDGCGGGDLSSRAALKVMLPGGARMEIGDARQAALAAELLRALDVKGHIAC